MRAAGDDYPADVVELYGKDTLPADALGPQSLALLQQIYADAPRKDPYDLAVAIRDTLLDPNQFEYDIDLTDEGRRCEEASIVECFVVTRSGFCQYYASTMAVFLRELGIPARFVEGFLPGEPDPIGNGRTIRSSDAHAWSRPTSRATAGSTSPDGRPNQGRPRPDPDRVSGRERHAEALEQRLWVRCPPQHPRHRCRPTGPGPLPGRGGPPVGLFIGIFILLAVVVGSLAAVAWRRGPRGPMSADDVYGSVARLAGRLGFGPGRPRRSMSTRAPWPTSFRWSDPNWRRWHGPRSRSRMAARPSATTGWLRFGTPTSACVSSCSG